MYMQPQNNYFISFENVRIRMKEPHVLNWVFFGPLRIPAMPICLLVPCVQQGYTHYVGIILSTINALSIMPIKLIIIVYSIKFQHYVPKLIFSLFSVKRLEKNIEFASCLIIQCLLRLAVAPAPAIISFIRKSFSILTLTLGHWRIKTIIY